MPLNKKGHILMVDARNIYRKVNRKIFDFSPEQLQNLSSIVWLYRGQSDRFIDLCASYIDAALNHAHTAFQWEAMEPLDGFLRAKDQLEGAVKAFVEGQEADTEVHQLHTDWLCSTADPRGDIEVLRQAVSDTQRAWNESEIAMRDMHDLSVNLLTRLGEIGKATAHELENSCKLAERFVAFCEKNLAANKSKLWDRKRISPLLKSIVEHRDTATEHLRQIRYYERNLHWLLSRFPDAKLVDVPGLVKLVDRAEIAAADWSLTPGRYVGVAPAEVDDDFDFEQALGDIHVEIKDLNQEAAELAKRIQKNFEGLGV